MDNTTEGRTLPDTAPKRRRIAYKDIAGVSIVIVIILACIGLLLTRISMKHDIAGAQIIADKVIADVSKQDGGAARKLGNAEFKKLYTDAALTKQFQSISEATVGKPTIDRQHLQTKSSKKTVFTIYKYPPRLADRSFYVRVGVTQSDGTWKLTSLSGSANEAQLITR